MQLSKKVTKVFNIPDDPDGAWVKIKHLKINEVKKVESKASDMFYTADDKGEGSTRINFDPYTRSRMFAHEALTDWGGFVDTMGKPLKFNTTNIDKAAEFIVTVNEEEFDFYGWIEKCRETLTSEVEVGTEEAEEN
jgi:hypothetical protein